MHAWRWRCRIFTQFLFIFFSRIPARVELGMDKVFILRHNYNHFVCDVASDPPKPHFKIGLDAFNPLTLPAKYQNGAVKASTTFNHLSKQNHLAMSHPFRPNAFKEVFVKRQGTASNDKRCSRHPMVWSWYQRSLEVVNDEEVESSKYLLQSSRLNCHL